MKPEIEKHEAVLLALYAQALHGGAFCEVTRVQMEMDANEFTWALYVLQMRGWVCGCAFQPPNPSAKERVMGVLRDALMLTPEGFSRAEALARAAVGTDGHLTSGMMLHGVWNLLSNIGCGIMANVIYSWIG